MFERNKRRVAKWPKRRRWPHLELRWQRVYFCGRERTGNQFGIRRFKQRLAWLIQKYPLD
jgi:hypothetical protein